MKQKLASLIRQTLENVAELSNTNELHCRKLEICRELNLLMNVLQPGLSRLRGIVLYEQFTSLYKLSKLNAEKGEIKNVEYFVSRFWFRIVFLFRPSTIAVAFLQEKLGEAEAIVVDAIKILIYEPIDNPEGLLARRAMTELKQLRGERSKLERMVKKINRASEK